MRRAGKGLGAGVVAVSVLAVVLSACRAPVTPSVEPSRTATDAPAGVTAPASATASARIASPEPSPSSSPSVAPSASPSPSAEPSAATGPSILVFEDDFSDPDSGFPTGDFEHQTVRYADGELVLALRTPGHSTWSMRDLRAVSDWPVARVEGLLRATTAAGDAGYYGLMCGRDNSTYYAGLLYTGGGSVLLRVLDGVATVLRRDEAAVVGLDPTRAAALRLDCLGDPVAGTVTVELSLAGRPVASVTDPSSAAGFRRVGVYAESGPDSEAFRVVADDVSAYVGLTPVPPGSAPPGTPTPSPVDARLAALLAHVPAAIRATCVEVEEVGAVVSVACTPPDPGVDSVRYTQYVSETAMDAAYDADVAEYGDGADGSSCAEGPATGPYTIGGVTAGRVLCFRDLGRAWIEWTDERLDILSVADRIDANFEELYEWWLEAGPVL
jgi:hypothetical protein